MYSPVHSVEYLCFMSDECIDITGKVFMKPKVLDSTQSTGNVEALFV